MPAASTAKWQRKTMLCSLLIIYHIEDVRRARARNRKTRNQPYRGLEHYWYGVWAAELARLCEKSETLVPCPQRWVSRLCFDNSNKRIKEHLVPDFLLLRVAEPRRSNRTRRPARSRVQDANPVRKTILQKVGALFEIKTEPEGEDDVSVWTGLIEGRDDVTEQALLFFAKQTQKGIVKEEQKVIGIYAAGQFWAWEALTPNNIGKKPLSVNKDPTYRGSEEPQPPASPDLEHYYRLNTPESNRAMGEMLQALMGLPGSEPFLDLH